VFGIGFRGSRFRVQRSSRFAKQRDAYLVSSDARCGISRAESGGAENKEKSSAHVPTHKHGWPDYRRNRERPPSPHDETTYDEQRDHCVLVTGYADDSARSRYWGSDWLLSLHARA
jgi:hypothetical protein